ncbi:MAG: ribonuclease E activity regulator RraA [Burkholderiales bacterium]|nr:ribonuclease E activity regulator RraA [Burkholderiales bacterium]
MAHKTADLFDQHGERLQVALPLFRRFGRRTAFDGEIVTLKCFEDNKSVNDVLRRGGRGKVLVIDGGGSLRCALVGGNLAALAVENGWSGIVVNGCVRDAVELEALDIGIRALATNPARPAKRWDGLLDLPLAFAGVRWTPGHHVYADEDGIVIAEAHNLEDER